MEQGVSVDREIRVKRGDVWLVEEQENVSGSIYMKERPWVICQSPIGVHSSILLAAPLSSTQKSKKHNFLQDVSVFTESQVHYEGLTSITRSSLVKWVYKFTRQEIEEMDLRLCVPLDLAKTSILHTEKVVIKNRQVRGNVKVFTGELVLKFYTEKIRFTSKDFEEYFGKTSVALLDGDLALISGFLESLKGLKFLYKLTLK